MTPSQQERLREIEQREKAATRGPWYILKRPDSVPASSDPEETILLDGYSVVVQDKPPYDKDYVTGVYSPIPVFDDAEFIAYSRSDIPWLLSLISALQEEVGRLASLNQRMKGITAKVKKSSALSSFLERRRLEREFMKRYAKHDELCDTVLVPTANDPCNCGYDSALAALARLEGSDAKTSE